MKNNFKIILATIFFIFASILQATANELPLHGTAPDGSSCINTFPYFCPQGSTYPDVTTQGEPAQNSSGDETAADGNGELPVHGIAPDGSACINTFPFFCPPGSTYSEGPTQGEPAQNSGDDETAADGNGELPVHGIAPDGSACINTFPFFCPPGSTYPDELQPGGGTKPPSESGEASGEASAQDIADVERDNGAGMLTGDTRLACEAILCLAAAGAPSECQPSLAKYFSIVFKSISKTLRARKAFLSLCPISRDEGMPQLIDAMVDGAGRCTPEFLNSPSNAFISSTLPSNCNAYYGNSMIQEKPPRYVGREEQGGFWVSAENYDAALEEYARRQKERVDSELEQINKY